MLGMRGMKTRVYPAEPTDKESSRRLSRARAAPHLGHRPDGSRGEATRAGQYPAVGGGEGARTVTAPDRNRFTNDSVCRVLQNRFPPGELPEGMVAGYLDPTSRSSTTCSSTPYGAHGWRTAPQKVRAASPPIGGPIRYPARACAGTVAGARTSKPTDTARSVSTAIGVVKDPRAPSAR